MSVNVYFKVMILLLLLLIITLWHSEDMELILEKANTFFRGPNRAKISLYSVLGNKEYIKLNAVYSVCYYSILNTIIISFIE